MPQKKANKTKIKSWEVSDAFWAKVAPLIPKARRDSSRTYQRRRGGGRKPMDPRNVFKAIVFVLRTGIQRKALPREFGSASSVHAYFMKWAKAGVFLRLWKKGLAEYDEMEGIAWSWQSIDGSQGKAPLATEAVGPNPTDRGKKRNQKAHAGGRAWSPVVDSRDRSQSPRCDAGGERACDESPETTREEAAESLR